jgi:hypothetical protein
MHGWTTACCRIANRRSHNPVQSQRRLDGHRSRRRSSSRCPHISDLLGGKAAWQKEEIEVGENPVWQSLNTGLFSSRGSSRLGWAQQTYAEFLAARFLVDGNFTPDRIMSLILHEDGKVVPQLHELAAWLASMVPDLFRRLMKLDAEFLLRSNAATADFKDRQDLIENLLSLFDRGELLDFDWDQRRRYRKLQHPNLLSNHNHTSVTKQRALLFDESRLPSLNRAKCNLSRTS